MADKNFWNVPTVKNDIHEKISDIKNCQYPTSSVATDIVPAICYLSNMKEELRTNDLKTAEMNVVKIMCSKFSPERVKDALKNYSVLAKNYNIDKTVDVVSKNIEKTKRKLDYKVSASQSDISKVKLGREASCKEVYLQARNESYVATGATGHADYIALGRMVGKFPVDEIKKTFRENLPSKQRSRAPLGAFLLSLRFYIFLNN